MEDVKIRGTCRPGHVGAEHNGLHSCAGGAAYILSRSPQSGSLQIDQIGAKTQIRMIGFQASRRCGTTEGRFCGSFRKQSLWRAQVNVADGAGGAGLPAIRVARLTLTRPG